MAVSTCPDAATLHAFARGSLARNHWPALEDHLLTCSRCARAFAALLQDDSLTTPLQGTAAPVFLQPSGIHELLERFIQQRHAQRTSAPTESAVPPVMETLDVARPGPAVAAPAQYASLLAPPQRDDELGRLAGFRILRVLGEGGMGIVFAAEDLQLHRPVALRVMKSAAAAHQDGAARFLREARAAAALKHDHIVTIYQVGEHNGVPFLAMEFLHGQSLDDRLASGPSLTAGEIVRLGRQMAEALAAAHAVGLIHRDIKPANVWLEAPRERVKLLDFGLARLARDQQLTQSGAVLGTPAYMAPEQARGAALGSRADLFSLGVVLYQLATGTQPFQRDTVMSTLMALGTETPPPVQSCNPTLPPALAQLIDRLVAKQPGDRPASAAEVASELETIERLLATAVVVPRQGRRLPVVVGLVAALVAAMLLVGVVVIRITDTHTARSFARLVTRW